MYDKEQIEDSLEFCRRAHDVYAAKNNKDKKNNSEFTTKELFKDMEQAINEIGDKKPWEKVLEELDDFSGKDDVPVSIEVTNEIRKPQISSESSSFKLISNIIVVVMCMGIALGIASFVSNYVIDQTTVEGESMSPTLENGDCVLVKKLSYLFGEPKRYDIVIFPVGYDEVSKEKIYYIKRIIGLPGETVQVVDGKININGSPLCDDEFSNIDIKDAGLAQNPIILGSDDYFVLGDNRNKSTDSRSSYVGLVKRRKIVGKAGYIMWPLSDIGGL